MTVYYDDARQRWRYDFRRHGQRHHGYCEHADGRPAANKTEARRIEEGHKAAADNRPGTRVGTPHEITLSQLFITYLTTQKGKGGYQSARDHVTEFLARPQFHPDRAAHQVSDQDIIDYTDWAQDQTVLIWMGGPHRRKQDVPAEQRAKLFKPGKAKRKPSSINRMLDTLRAAFQLAHDMRDPVTKQRLLDPMPRIVKLATPKRKPRPMSLSLADRAMELAPPHLRDGLWLTTTFGFREGEAIRFRRQQVDFENRGIWLYGEEVKENRDAFIPATDATLQRLRQMCDRAEAAGQDRLVLYLDPRSGRLRPIKSFGASWQRIRRLLQLQGRHSFHNTRGTFAQRLVKGKVDPRVTQSLMRHTHASTTAAYYEIEDEMRRDAIEAIERRAAHQPPANDNPTPTPDSHTRRGKRRS